VALRRLTPPLSVAGDPASAFAGGRPLRILLDLPETARQPDSGTWATVTPPTPATMLWSLCQNDAIDLTWVTSDVSDARLGALHMQPPNDRDNNLPYVTHTANGHMLAAISPLDQIRHFAATEPGVTFDTLVRAALAFDMRVDLMVTDDPAVLALGGFYGSRANAMTVEESLAYVGLLLRANHNVPVVGPNAVTFDRYSLAWSAVVSQVPDAWAWRSALIDHGLQVGDDYPSLLTGSFHERLVRVLKQRDHIHRASLQPATFHTGHTMTEALDTLLFNLVGAFDATALAAHLGAGLPWAEHEQASWQKKDWRKRLGAPALEAMFYKKAPVDDLFFVCRRLRNTVHGAGLPSMVANINRNKSNLVQLPSMDAADIVTRLDRLGGSRAWGIRDLGAVGVYVDAGEFTEQLLPRAFEALNAIVAQTPQTGLILTNGQTTPGPPTDNVFDAAARQRACLLYGLPVPAK
jgi:hypothetical protein